MMAQKKEESKTAIEAVVIQKFGNNINVLDIKVEDNFDIDNI